MIPLLRRAARRCGEGQSHTHAAARTGVDELERWATRQQAAPGYLWWELAAGASSSVAAHALLAAAADRRTTAEEAELIDAVYFPPIGALTVLLDDLIDREDDLRTGQHNYLSYCAERGAGGEPDRPARRPRQAATLRLRGGRRHRAILAGVAGFYLSAPALAADTLARSGSACSNHSTRPCGRSWSRCACAAMAEREGPAYVAIITDGNGRWAKARGLSVGDGHRAGAENVRARLRDAVELGIRELTVYAFSTENWSRSPAEVKYLIDLIAEYIDRVTPELHAENVRLRFIGERGDPVPPGLVKRMEWAEGLTADNEMITLFVPFNYGGRAEIVRAARAFNGTTEEEFRAGLYARKCTIPSF